MDILNMNIDAIKAYQRGQRVRKLGHALDWYKQALAAYSPEERESFLAGYNDGPRETR